MANILIADDSIIMRRNLRTILTKAGHNIVGEAINGQQAHLLYSKSEVDIVTLDITMPVMDGIEALKKIIERDPGARVIIISALDQKRMVYQALELGAKYYIIKPITEEKILNAIDKVMSMEQSCGLQPKAEPVLQTQASKQSADVSNIIPFSITNENGTFIIHISEALNKQTIGALEMTMEGFLLIKPLKVVFDFSNSIRFDEDVLLKLVEISHKIDRVKGDFQVVAMKPINDFFNK